MRIAEHKYYYNNKEKNDTIKEALNDFDEDTDRCVRCNRVIDEKESFIDVEEMYGCDGELMCNDKKLPRAFTDNLHGRHLCTDCARQLDFSEVVTIPQEIY